MVFLHSFSELTELPFAFLMALGFWAYQRRQFLLLAIVMGFGPLSRPEGFGFLAIVFVTLVLHRRWWWTPVLLLPLIGWDYFGWRLNGSEGQWWLWLKHSWPYSQESLYERGPLLHFVLLLPVVVSPLLLPATFIGAWRCLIPFRDDATEADPRHRDARGAVPHNENKEATRASQLQHVLAPTPSPGTPGEGRDEGVFALRTRSACHNDESAAHRWVLCFFTNHARRCELLIVGLPTMILIGHSLLYWLGKMASNGEIRYMMVVAPFWALLSARGWAWVFSVMDWKRPLLWAGLAAMLPVLVNRAWTTLPMDNFDDWVEAERIARWYHTSGTEQRYPYLEISHVGLQYFLAIDPESGRLRNWTKSTIDSRPPKTLLIWDRVGALYNSDVSRKVPLDEIRRAGWKHLNTHFSGGVGEWDFFLSE